MTKFVMVTIFFANRGAVAGSNTEEANERVDLLKDEIARLDTYEKTIDQHKQWCMQVQLADHVKLSQLSQMSTLGSRA